MWRFLIFPFGAMASAIYVVGTAQKKNGVVFIVSLHLHVTGLEWTVSAMPTVKSVSTSRRPICSKEIIMHTAAPRKMDAPLYDW